MDTDGEPEPGKKRKPKEPKWFGTKSKIQGNSLLKQDDEFDLLSLCIAQCICKTDEDLSPMIYGSHFIDKLVAGSKVLKDKDGLKGEAILIRYLPPEVPITVDDKRISYRKSLDGKTSRWAVKGVLIPMACLLLTEIKRSEIAIAVKVDEQGEARVTGDSEIVFFRQVRRDPHDITKDELDEAEAEIAAGKEGILAKEVREIWKALHHSAEKSVKILCEQIRSAKDNLRAEQILNAEKVSKLTSEITMLKSSVPQEISRLNQQFDFKVKILNVQADEQVLRSNLISQYHQETIMALQKTRPKFSEARKFTESKVQLACQIDMTLEDAKAEITRLNEVIRTRKAGKIRIRKVTKNDDIRIATDATIRRSTKDMSSGSPVSQISRSRKGTSSSSRGVPIRELEIGRELKSLCVLREKNRSAAESASLNLHDLEAHLSSQLTEIQNITEDILERREEIITRVRAMIINDKAILTRIRDHPHFLAMTQEMNQERRPCVEMRSLRSVINASKENLKMLENTDKVKIDVIEMFQDLESLTQAAEQGLDERFQLAETPEIVEQSSPLPPAQTPILIRLPKPLLGSTVRVYDS